MPDSPSGVPRDFRGKVVMAFRLLFQQLPLITALVLTIWIPGQLLIEAAQAGNPNPADVLSVVQLSMLVEIVFGPICTGGVITALAAQMSGEKTPYPEAIRAGLHHWGRLFGARIVAQGLVMLGLLAFIIPGIILAVRFSLIDEVVVLEGAGVTAARNRSVQLTRGKGIAHLPGLCVRDLAEPALLDHAGDVAGARPGSSPIRSSPSPAIP